MNRRGTGLQHMLDQHHDVNDVHIGQLTGADTQWTKSLPQPDAAEDAVRDAEQRQCSQWLEQRMQQPRLRRGGRTFEDPAHRRGDPLRGPGRVIGGDRGSYRDIQRFHGNPFLSTRCDGGSRPRKLPAQESAGVCGDPALACRACKLASAGVLPGDAGTGRPLHLQQAGVLLRLSYGRRDLQYPAPSGPARWRNGPHRQTARKEGDAK